MLPSRSELKLKDADPGSKNGGISFSIAVRFWLLPASIIMLHNYAMRTTLMINDELVAAAKGLAAERGCSLSSVVSDALRMMLNADSRRKSSREFRMLCYRGKETLIDTSPAELSELDHSADLEPLNRR